MKMRVDLDIGGKTYPKGASFPWHFIYPFFLLPMLGFGLSGFVMAYSNNGPGLIFLYLHAGFADYFWEVRLIAFLYYLLYTFLLCQMVLDVSGARSYPQRRRLVESFYVGASLLVYGIIYLKE